MTGEELLAKIKNDVSVLRSSTDKCDAAIRNFGSQQAIIRDSVRRSGFKLNKHKVLKKYVEEGDIFSKMLADGVKQRKAKYQLEDQK